MNAYLYVCDCTFLHNGYDTDKEVCEKVLNIGEMVYAIRNHRDENTLQINIVNFLNTKLLSEGSTIQDVLWGDKAKQFPNAQKILLNLINSTPNCNYSYKEMIDALSNDIEKEKSINALVAMNKIDGIPESHQVLYDVQGFFKFRRYFIEKYPSSTPTAFLRDIDKYYEKIVLNSNREQVESGMKDIMNMANNIAHALTALNDDFAKEFKEKTEDNLNNFLNAFAKRHSMDGGSMGGRAKRKELNCNFEELGWQYCGPHLKFFPDKKDNRKGHLRIYFCWENDNIDKIYVGLICNHV